jgi:hypothetical protein
MKGRNEKMTKRRFATLALALVMLMSLMSATALADGNSETDEAYSLGATDEWWNVSEYGQEIFTQSPDGLTTSTAFSGQRTLTGEVDGESLTLTHYWGWYAKNPNSTKQRINIYVPENATDDSAVLFLLNNSGWRSNDYPDTISDSFSYDTALTDKTSGNTSAGVLGTALDNAW